MGAFAVDDLTGRVVTVAVPSGVLSSFDVGVTVLVATCVGVAASGGVLVGFAMGGAAAGDVLLGFAGDVP